MRVAIAVVLCALVGAGSISAQSDQRAAAREVVKKWQDSVINVRVVLKTRMAVAGREMQSSDDTVEAVATVIDPSGLSVMSLGMLNPGAMMNRMMGAAASGTEHRMELTSEPTDLKMRLPDGREIAAKIVLRDEDLDLAFIRPSVKADKPFIAINLADAGRPALLDEVIVLSRLGRVGGWTAGASLFDIGAIIEKPRTFFVLGTTAGSMGTPAFLLNGKVVGLLTLRQIDAGRAGMLSAMSGTEAFGLLAVVLPAADVLEIAKQAMEK